MKDPLRQHFRALRDAVPGPRRAAAGEAIMRHASLLPQWMAADVVLLYASFGSEVPTQPLFEAAWTGGKRTGLPRIQGRDLVLHEVARSSSLFPNALGIPEPGPETATLRGEDVGVVIVPGVAFDRRGGRLGYGGGYYDRLLGTVPQAFRVGLAYKAQVVEHLPTTHLDVPMDALVTEAGVHILPSRKH